MPAAPWQRSRVTSGRRSVYWWQRFRHSWLTELGLDVVDDVPAFFLAQGVSVVRHERPPARECEKQLTRRPGPGCTDRADPRGPSWRTSTRLDRRRGLRCRGTPDNWSRRAPFRAHAMRRLRGLGWVSLRPRPSRRTCPVRCPATAAFRRPRSVSSRGRGARSIPAAWRKAGRPCPDPRGNPRPACTSRESRRQWLAGSATVEAAR